MTLLHRNPNRRARRERTAALLAEAAGAPAVGDVVRVLRDTGTVDVVRIVDSYVSAASGIHMLTVRNAPFGIQTASVRADAVLSDDAPDIRHDATECVPRCATHDLELRSARDHEDEGWDE